MANRNASAETVHTYRSQVAHFVDWCNGLGIEPAAITHREVMEYRRYLIEEKRLKPASVALKLSVLRRFYAAALEHCASLGGNPAAGVGAPREKVDPAERICYLEENELQRLLDALPRDETLQSLRDRALISIMALEGPRSVEMHRLDLGDVVVQGKNWGLRVEGKRNRRIVPLTSDLAQLLEHYIEVRRRTAGTLLGPDEPLFVAVGNRAGGQRLSRRGLRQVVDRHLEAANLKKAVGRTLSAHSLRHTAGTLGLRAGADLRQVQDLLGHANPQTTAIYAHVNDRWAANPAGKIDIRL